MTAVLVLRGPASALPETLGSLARQTRSPDRLVVVDAGLDGNAVEQVRAHRGVAEAIDPITFVTVPGAASLAYAVRSALSQTEEVAAQAPGAAIVWAMSTARVAKLLKLAVVSSPPPVHESAPPPAPGRPSESPIAVTVITSG